MAAEAVAGNAIVPTPTDQAIVVKETKLEKIFLEIVFIGTFWVLLPFGRIENNE